MLAALSAILALLLVTMAVETWQAGHVVAACVLFGCAWLKLGTACLFLLHGVGFIGRPHGRVSDRPRH